MFHNNLNNKKEIISNNYMVLYYPDHPNSHTKGYVYYHRLVMENYLDRYLDPDEHVHHIDDNPLNNDIENLELMTKRNHIKLHTIQRHIINNTLIKERFCKQCNKLFKPSHNKIKFCSPICSQLNQKNQIKSIRKTNRPTKEELHKLVWSMSTIDVAKQFGVSDVAISKWCNSYGISKPPRGYWAKVYSGKIQPSIPNLN